MAYGNSLDEIENDVLDFSVLVPVRGHAEVGDYVGGGPPIQTYVDLSGETLV